MPWVYLACKYCSTFDEVLRYGGPCLYFSLLKYVKESVFKNFSFTKHTFPGIFSPMNFFSLLLKMTQNTFFTFCKKAKEREGKKRLLLCYQKQIGEPKAKLEKATLIVDPDWVNCYWEDNPSHLRESERRQEEEGKLCTLHSVLTVKPDRPKHAQWVKAESYPENNEKSQNQQLQCGMKKCCQGFNSHFF